MTEEDGPHFKKKEKKGPSISRGRWIEFFRPQRVGGGGGGGHNTENEYT